MILSAMDLYDESFKITDMIDSDLRGIRSELDDYFSELPRTPGSPILSLSHPSAVSMDVSDNTMDSEFSDDGRIGWMNSSQMYNVSSDLDSISGLLVNPETALPVSMTSLSATAITVSSGISGAVNVTLTPSKTDSPVSSGSIELPLQVITTTTAVLSEDKHSQVNVTVAVPAMKTEEEMSGDNLPKIQNVFAVQKIKDADEIPKPRSRQKQNSKVVLHQGGEENSYPKPAYSYSCLIAMALKNSRTGSLPVNEIYDFMIENFPYFKTAPNGWKNSVRHNLSLNKCFEKIEKPTGNGAQRKGYLWALNPSKVEKMEEEFKKWSSKDPAAIRKSMANPERLELIERGELKKTDVCDISIKEVGMLPAVDIKKEREEDVKDAPIKSSRNDTTSNEFSPLDEPVGMDSSLPDLDLQKGLWENFSDDRLQFMAGSPMDSSSPKQTEARHSGMNEDSSSSSPSDTSESFHGNYSYSCSDHLEAKKFTHSNRQNPCLTDEKHKTTCDV